MKFKICIIALVLCMISVLGISAQPKVPPPVPSAAPPAPKIEYHVVINGKQGGPFDMTALEKMKSQNLFTKETLVWKDGMNGWTPAGQVKELASVFEEKKPAPAKPAPAKPQPPAVTQEAKPAVPPAPPAPPKPQVSIYAIIDGAQSGPFDWDALEDMKKSGKLTPQTLVWEEGMDGWTQAQVAPKLIPLFTAVGVIAKTVQTFNPKGAMNAKDHMYIDKIIMGKYNVNPADQQGMQFIFKKQINTGIALAVAGGCLDLFCWIPIVSTIWFGPVGMITGSVLTTVMALSGTIMIPMCAIPFSRSGRTVKVYHKVTGGDKLMSFLQRTSIGGGYDWEKKEATMAMAIRL